MPESRKIGLIIFFVLLLSYLFFSQNYKNSNIVSRMSLTLSILQERTVKINRFHEATTDKAYYNGDYYSDKAPGIALSSLPISTVVYNILRIFDPNPVFIIGDKVTNSFGLLVYFSTIITSGLLTACTALALYFIALHIGANIPGAVFAMVSFGLATQAWGWATALFGHAMASACLFLGFTAIYYSSLFKHVRHKVALLGFATGALLAWAIVAEYTAVFASAIIGVYGLFSLRKWGRTAKFQFITCASAGFFLFILPLIIYNYVAFGSPFSVGYNYVQSFEGMKEGFFGISIPDFNILIRLIISPYRGLLWFSPILLLTPIAIYLLWRNHKNNKIALMVIALAVYYLLVNSAYHYWHGGFSTGPRHLTPIIPFLCLPLSLVWTNARSTYKPLVVILFFISFIIALLSVSVTMYSPEKIGNPLFDFLIPGLLNGDARNIVLIILRKLNEPFRSEIFRNSMVGLLSLLPIIFIWIIGYLLVANRVNKLQNAC